MEHWTNLIVVLHVLIALGIIGLVLLQHGKGADMGSGFGGGASSSLFGASGSANFLSRTTAVLATLFFLSSLPGDEVHVLVVDASAAVVAVLLTALIPRQEQRPALRRVELRDLGPRVRRDDRTRRLPGGH